MFLKVQLEFSLQSLGYGSSTTITKLLTDQLQVRAIPAGWCRTKRSQHTSHTWLVLAAAEPVQRGGLPGEAVVPGPTSPGASAASPGPGLSRAVVPSRGLGAGLAGVRGGDVHGGTLLQIARVVASVLHVDVLLDSPIFLNEKKALNVMKANGI